MDNYLENLQTKSYLQQIDDLLHTRIFDQKFAGHPLQAAAFTQLMVLLNDILQKLNREKKRINFNDDISYKDVSDITDLVSKMRNAACHIYSKNREMGNITSVYNVSYGKGGICPGNDSEYDDDCRIFYGEYGIYYNRHIVRALEEARRAVNHLFA